MTRKWAQQTRYTLRRNTASMMKGLFSEYLTRNNQGRRQKNFQEEAIGKKRAIVHQRKPSFISCGRLGDALDNCPRPNLKDILHHEPRIKVKTFSRETPNSEKKLILLRNFQVAKKLFA